MRTRKSRRLLWGFTPLEIMAVIAVIAVLLGLGVIVVRSARRQAHLVQAQSRLKQVSTALELYYGKYGHYPAMGKDLVEELEEFVEDETIFENPLAGETNVGDTITVLYHEPTSEEVDKPETYITGFVGEDGETAVVLKTNGKVVMADGLDYTPGDGTDAKIEVMTFVESEGANQGGGGTTGGTSGGTTGGTTGTNDSIRPNLAIFVLYDVNTKSNKGHGNNLDHDDYDNPGKGGGGHGTADGFVPDDSVGYDDDEIKGGPYRISESLVTFGIANTTEAPNDAAGVCVDVIISEGAEYVKSLDYTREIGDLAAGESKPFIFGIKLNNAWKKADTGAKVLVAVTITAETNCPEENVGKKVEALIAK